MNREGLGPWLTASGDVPADRLKSRAESSRLLDRAGGSGGGYTGLQGKALDLLLSPTLSTAFDLSRESAAVRDLYRRHAHGQSRLLARRLVEAGTRLVTVNWPDDGETLIFINGFAEAFDAVVVGVGLRGGSHATPAGGTIRR